MRFHYFPTGDSGSALPPKEKVDVKLTLEDEADLTAKDLEEMARKVEEPKSKGSAGPEEKDIVV